MFTRRTLWVPLSVLSLAGPALAIMARDYSHTITAHRAEVDACYATERARLPSLSGVVGVEFNVGPRGNLLHGESVDGEVHGDRVIAASGPLTAVGNCILARARTWQFEMSSSGRLVRYDFAFAPTAPFTLREVPWWNQRARVSIPPGAR